MPSLADLFGAIDRIDTTEITRQISNLKATVQRRTLKLNALEAQIQSLKFIHQLKQQHRRIIHEGRANIFLDATATAGSISFRSGIPVENILVCEALHDQGATVHHLQVPDFGLAGKNRKDSTDVRIKAAIAGLVSGHEGCNPVVFYQDGQTPQDCSGSRRSL